jgi:hypothetical protein
MMADALGIHGSQSPEPPAHDVAQEPAGYRPATMPPPYAGSVSATRPNSSIVRRDTAGAPSDVAAPTNNAASSAPAVKSGSSAAASTFDTLRSLRERLARS